MDGIRMLRLNVFGPNLAAKKVYTQMGFEQGGSIPQGVLYKGEYVSYDLMYKKL